MVAIDICDSQYIDKKIVRIPPVVSLINCGESDILYTAAELNFPDRLSSSRAKSNRGLGGGRGG